MALLDSDILIGLLRNDPAAQKKMSQLLETDQPLSTTTITSFELFKGALLSSRREENLREVYGLLQSLHILPFDFRASLVCARQHDELARSKQELPLADLMVSGIAAAAGETLVTRNAKDFSKVPSLKTETW